MNVVRTVVSGIVVVSLCGAAFAAEDEAKEHKGPPRDGKARFEAADTDGSGGISLEEFKAGHEKRMAAMKEHMGDRWDPARAAQHPGPEEIFKKIDADGNGQLTQEEMMAHGKKMSETRGRHGEGPHGGGKGGPHGGDKGGEKAEK